MEQKRKIIIKMQHVIAIIIIVTLLIILFFCGMTLRNKTNNSEKNNQQNNEEVIEPDIITWTPKEKEKEEIPSISSDELDMMYAKMDYSDQTEIRQFGNYHIATYNGKDYYVIDKDYEKDFDLQFAKLHELFEQEKDEEDYKKFHVKEVMDYDKYKSFCEEWKLEQKYDDKNSNYVVFAYESGGFPSVEARLSEVEFNGDTANLYMWQDVCGDDNLDFHMAYMIVVPTKENVKNVEVKHLYTQKEMNVSISKDLYGDDYNGKYDIYYTEEKPIIYLYPTTDTKVAVQLGNNNKITSSYPKYENGWNVLAKPNGDLLDLNTNRNLYSLYYESQTVEKYEATKDGFVVRGADTIEFLEEKLAKLGLTEREAEEFIVYWLPRLQQNKYNYIRFATQDEINTNMPINITPKPDTLIRIMMTFKGLDRPINVIEQKIETPKRDGFVAVEWGGTEIK